jgi:hypothetical protein
MILKEYAIIFSQLPTSSFSRYIILMMLAKEFLAAEKALSNYLKGTLNTASDTAKQVTDTTKAATAAATSQADTNAISGFEVQKIYAKNNCCNR